MAARASGTIEDAPSDVLHLDFANEYIGGGVLGRGCVQEEIRFLLSPELIVARLVCEVMGDHEAILLSGFERFAAYEGYAGSFRYAGPYEDAPSRDRRPTLLAIDALHFRGGGGGALQQYAPRKVERELNKALAGFQRPPSSASVPTAVGTAPLAPVCTGNWGCGAFGGDLQLKAIIQWLAASAAGRPRVDYLTFGDEGLASGLNELARRLVANKCSVTELARLVTRRFSAPRWPHALSGQVSGYYADLFAFLHHRIDTHEVKEAARAAAAAADAEEEEAPPDGAHTDVGVGAQQHADAADTEEDEPSEDVAAAAAEATPHEGAPCGAPRGHSMPTLNADVASVENIK